MQTTCDSPRGRRWGHSQTTCNMRRGGGGQSTSLCLHAGPFCSVVCIIIYNFGPKLHCCRALTDSSRKEHGGWREKRGLGAAGRVRAVCWVAMRSCRMRGVWRWLLPMREGKRATTTKTKKPKKPHVPTAQLPQLALLDDVGRDLLPLAGDGHPSDHLLRAASRT